MALADFGIGQIASSLINAYTTVRENRKTRAYNRELARLQNQYNIDQWNRENSYNDPVNQRRRLERAGFNPNLAFTNGMSNISAPSPDLTAGAPATPAPISIDLNDAMLKRAQARNLDADSAKKEEETKGQSIQNNLLSSMSPELEKQLHLSNDYMQKQAALADAEMAKVKETTKGQQILNDIQAFQRDFQNLTKDDYIKFMKENWSAQNRALQAEGRSKDASAFNTELINRIWSNAQRNPELFQKLVNGYANTGEISTQEAIKLTGENVKEGNTLAAQSDRRGQAIFGALGLVRFFLGGLIPKL